ncbi:MAG TPA: FHA domain-containing protein [Vicinamibacterales bacterium]|nr:FHA domain-containing protein [Vicinamibacterales bacterium]
MRIAFDRFVFDDETRRLTEDGVEVHLSPKAFELLRLLVEYRPKTIAKRAIHERLWPGVFVSDSNLPAIVAELRGALKDDAQRPRVIRTARGFGYAFDAATRGVSAGRPDAPAAWLVGDTRTIDLALGEQILGREGDGVLIVPSTSVSRRHARLTVAADRASVEDFGSKNGTFVNDKKLSSAAALKDGDQLRLGSVLFTFRRAAPGSTTSTLTSTRRIRR